MTAIQTIDLIKQFDDVTALNKVNIAVPYNRIFGLLGPNGAGKSTFIKIITTLLKPTSGEVYVVGSEVSKDPVTVRRNIGYVPQLISADGALTAYENLQLSARLYGIPRAEQKARIQDMLKMMDLENVSHYLVKTFSGGMVRRLEIAAALLHRPAILLMDEPTLGLDPGARLAFWDHLKEIHREYKMTILLSTHDMEEADYLCDELAILHHGQIVAIGEPETLKKTVGPEADLSNVFTHYTGGAIEGGSYRDARQTRNIAKRLG